MLTPLVPARSSILVGLSGGVDSVVLLHLLAHLASHHDWKLSALHVHHGISPHAETWTNFCIHLCELHGVPLRVERVDISPLRHLGIEAAARKLRHEILLNQPVDFIALAHHQDDQAETLLLQLLRGAGVKGAAAMPIMKRRRGLPALLRPLLDNSRAELLEYAQRQHLQWVEDESNADDSYPRNFLRHRALSLLEQQFPGCRATLARSARHFAEAAILLDGLAEQDARGGFDGESLAISLLKPLDFARAKNLLRWFLQQRDVLMPDQGRLEEMLGQLCEARSDAQPCIAWGKWELRRYRDRVYVNHILPEPEADLCIRWNGEQELVLPQLDGILRFEQCTGQGISAQKLHADSVTICLRHGEERLRPDTSRPARSLQYLFQEASVPPWLRVRWPLLYVDGKLAAVPSIAVDYTCQAGPNEQGYRLVWQAEMASDTGDKA